MTASIARYLKDFGEPTPVPPVLSDDIGDFAFGGGFEVPETPVDVPDVEAERSEAHAEGYEAGVTEARREWEDLRAQLQNDHAEEIAALRDKYEAEIASVVEKKMGEAAVLIAEAVSDQTARVLAPVVEQVLVSKAVADLADLLRVAILDGDAATITVHGPLHLFEKLTAVLGAEHAALFRHVEAADLDISADIGGSALVTRLSAWSARLKEVLA